MDKEVYTELTKKHIKTVQRYIIFFNKELTLRGIKHDASKLISPEVDEFPKYSKGNSITTKYGTENYKVFLNDMEKTLKHHYKNNRHHPEHFSNGILGMNLIDLIELISDWKASSSVRESDDLIKSIIIGQERFKYSDDIKQILLNTAELLYKYKLKWESNEGLSNIYLKDTKEEIIECIQKDYLLKCNEKELLIKNFINFALSKKIKNRYVGEIKIYVEYRNYHINE